MKFFTLIAICFCLALFSGCKPVQGDGRPFSGYNDPGFRLAITSDLSKAGQNGVPDLSELQTMDLNYAAPGGTPSLSAPFYLFSSVEDEPLVINKIFLTGENPQDFHVVGIELPVTLEYGEYVSFQFEFAPQEEGHHREAVAVIESERGSKPSIRLQGNSSSSAGEISILSNGYEMFNFENQGTNAVNIGIGAMEHGGRCPKPYDPTNQYEIKNLGTVPLVVRGARIIQEASLPFEWDESVNFPMEIPAGSSEFVKIRLKDSVPEESFKSAKVEFYSQDANEPKYSVEIHKYRPKSVPCIQMFVHEVGTEIPSSVPGNNLPQLRVGEIDREKHLMISLRNDGGAPASIDESAFSAEFHAFDELCEQASSIDFRWGELPASLQPGESYSGQIRIGGLAGCPSDLDGQRLPFRAQILRERSDRPGMIDQVMLEGDFLISSISSTQPITIRDNNRGVMLQSGTEIPVSDQVSLQILTNAPISLRQITGIENAWNIQGPRLPRALSPNQEHTLVMLPNSNPPEERTIVLHFSDRSTFELLLKPN